MKDFEAKTTLTDGQYNAMLIVIDAKGMTQAGYIRHLILQDIANSQGYVALISAITNRSETTRLSPENRVVFGKGGAR
jgi:hypothetical protein